MKRIGSGLVVLMMMAISCSQHDQVIVSQARYCFVTLHHTWQVPELTVYLKYDTTAFPGYEVSAYDTFLICDKNATGCFEHLPMGSHYVLALGYDSLEGAPVSGAKAFTISNLTEEKFDTLAVSE